MDVLEDKGCVLVIGNSGVGKSTLINAVMGDDVAKTSFGTEGTTKHLDIYDQNESPFRVIDTVGFEPGLIKRHQAIASVRKWSKEAADDSGQSRCPNVIWFCVDGTAAKLFPQAIESLVKATNIWKSLPIIVAITKSYGQPDRQKNIDMVEKAFEKRKISERVKAIVPVVASPYGITDEIVVAPENIDKLIEVTVDAMPEGKRGTKDDIDDFILGRKRVIAQTLVAATVTGGVAVGLSPIFVADAPVLAALETGMITGVAKVYGISLSGDNDVAVRALVDAGTTSAVAKAALSTLKAMPIINVPGAVLNGVVAGAFVATLGEVSIKTFDDIACGKSNLSDINHISDMAKQAMEDGFLDRVVKVAERIATLDLTKDVAKQLVPELLKVFIPSLVQNS